MDPDGQPLELKIFSRWVTWGVVFVCSGLFLGGIHWSGLDLNQINTSSKTFNPGENICVRSEALTVSKDSFESFEVCVEWIDLKDTSGSIHYLNPDHLDIFVGPNGEIRVRESTGINFPLLGFLTYVFVLIVAGISIQVFLIRRQKRKIEARTLQKDSGPFI